MVRKIVATVGLTLVILAVIMELQKTEANPCAAGSKGWQEVCELKKKSAVIYDDYREQLEKAGVR